MPKRKREEQDDADVEIGVKKKTKRQRLKKKSKSDSGNPTETVNAQAQTSSLPVPTSKPADSVSTSMEPPPDLNRNQRKRWRRRQKKQLLTSHTGSENHSNRDGSMHLSRTSKAMESSAETASRLLEKPKQIDPSLRRFAVTKLMPRAMKAWHQEDPATGKGVSKRTSIQRPKSNSNRRPALETDASSNTRLGATNASESEMNALEHRVKAVSSSSSSSSEDSDEESGPQQHTKAKVSDSRRTAAGNRLDRPDSVLERRDSPVMNFPRSATSNWRSSFGSKASFVPDIFPSTDSAESFERFAAFVDGDSSSSSNDSRESQDEARARDILDEPTNTDTLSRSNEAAQDLIMTTAAAHELPHDLLQNDNHHTPGDAETVKSNDDYGEQLPRFSESMSQVLSTATSWPANVGIKRRLSISGRELSATPSGFGNGLELESKSEYMPTTALHGDIFESNDDSQELLRTEDEISNTIFASTRPLPPSKSSPTPGPENGSQANGGLTSGSSGRRLTRSMMTPQKSQIRGVGSANGRGSNVVDVDPDVVSGRLPLSTTSQRASKPAESEGSSDSVSENIDVAVPDWVANSSDLPITSSSLSELSRSPSPPASFKFSQPTVHDTKNYAESWSANTGSGANNAVESTALEDEAVQRIEDEPAPRKKRKMTGRTSKHFSPHKKVTRSRTSAAQGIDKELSTDEAAADAGKNEDATANTSAGQLDRPTSSGSTRRRTRASSKVGDAEEPSAVNDHPEAAQRNDSLDTSATLVERPRSSGSARKRTRASSKAEGDENVTAANEITEPVQAAHATEGPALKQEEEPPVSHSTRSSAKKQRKSTGTRSSYFTPPKPDLDLSTIDRVDTVKRKRAPAGGSNHLVPPITSARFGIIQEKLWQEPFWLIIAVTFLNKTAGRAAGPTFWALKDKYPAAEALANADQKELCDMIWHLGLQNQRAKRCVAIAKAWLEAPPEKGRRARTLHYPAKEDGKELKRNEIVEEDADECAGALEIGHIPGCGPYAMDSWRMFCRDVLRGVAEDYNGKGAVEGFVPEWQKVLPLDKELRACLRWMWLREGFIWNHETGEKRAATEQEMERAFEGEMEIEDPQEAKFAEKAAGVEVSPAKPPAGVDASTLEESEAVDEDHIETADSTPHVKKALPVREEPVSTPEPPPPMENDSDAIVVTPASKPAKKPRKRLKSLAA